MGALLDVVSVVILVVCIWSAARRGFVKTIIGFVGTLLAVAAAWLVSRLSRTNQTVALSSGCAW